MSEYPYFVDKGNMSNPNPTSELAEVIEDFIRSKEPRIKQEVQDYFDSHSDIRDVHLYGAEDTTSIILKILLGETK